MIGDVRCRLTPARRPTDELPNHELASAGSHDQQDAP
jgi:hypothetical protein